MDGRTIYVDGMAPFLRNGKCRRLSSHGLDGRLHFFLYYITLEVGVNSLESDCNVEKKLRKSACATITFCPSSEELRILYSPFGKCLSDVDR